MIITKKLVRTFYTGGVPFNALKDINLEIKSGEFVIITGRSGSGKSTLLYQLGLLDQPTSGEILIDGCEATKLSNKASARFRLEKLGFVFQDYALLPELTALENVLVPLIMLGFTKKEAYQKAEDALRKLGLADRMLNLPSQLSGGQQQRVSIARAIAHAPKIIFADEPTANLDSEAAATVIAAFQELHQQGQTIVMVSHESEYARLAQRVIKLSDGQIIN